MASHGKVDLRKVEFVYHFVNSVKTLIGRKAQFWQTITDKGKV